MEQSWSLREAVDYYRNQGAPSSQEALVALLREVQEENGGVLPSPSLEEIAAAYGMKESFLAAVVKRIPSLRTEEAPHRLELCGGPNCAKQSAAALASFVEETYGVKPGGISRHGGFSYRVGGCMKHCGKGPNLKWDGVVHNGGTPDLIRALVSGKQ